jgi:hypothetical protein
VSRRLARRILFGVCLVSAISAAVYQDQVLGGPGYVSWQHRSSTWVRQVGLGGLLNRYQNWRYTRHAPPDSAPDARLFPTADKGAAHSVSIPGSALPPLAHTADGAGWHAVIRSPGAPAAAYTAVLQPDPAHRSVIAAVVLVRSSLVRAHLMAGTVEPAGSSSAGRIPPEQLPATVAAFNSGAEVSERTGGFLLNGATLSGLINGKASVLIDHQGRMSIGQWGRDVPLSAHVAAVRQNFDLIVDRGQPANGLDRNPDQRWGTAGSQQQFTWRSALGITARGDVIYVAGNELTLASAATALIQAGAVTGMQLSMHPGEQFCATWQANGSALPRPRRLISAMVGPPDRYIRPDQDDFFYFTATRP